MAKKNSLNLEGIDLSSFKKESDSSSLNLESVDLSSLYRYTSEEEGKKKVQTEETPSDTASVSEDVSLESPSTDEKPTEFKLPEVRSEEDELFKRNKGYYPGEQKSFYQNKEEEGTDLSNDAFREVSNYKGDFIDTPEEDLIDSLYEASDFHVRPDIAQAVSVKRSEELNALADTFLKEKEASIMDLNKDMGEDLAKDMARDSIRTESYEYALASTGLDAEDHTQFDEAILERYNDLNSISDLKDEYYSIKKDLNNADLKPEERLKLSQRNREIASEVKSLKEAADLADKKIGALREKSDVGFTDAEGNVNQELKADIESREDSFKKKYKSDYAKITSRLTQEKAKQDALVRSFTSDENFRSLDKVEDLEGLSRSILSGDKPVFESFLNPEKESKFNSYKDSYLESDKNIKALSRLALLNEDPAAVAKGIEGWGSLGTFLTAAGETLAEEVYGEVDTDRDFRQTIVGVLQEEGIKLTEEQIESGVPELSETLGDATATSLVLGAKILATRGMIGTAGKVLNAPKYLARIKYLRESPRLVSFLDKTIKGVTEGLAFELADERTDAAMGVGESIGEGALDMLGKSLSKTKLGRFTKYLDNYAGRLAKSVSGRTIGGVGGEYSGEWLSEGVKNGFFTEEQFKNTFGEGEEATTKFFINTVLALGMGLPSSAISSLKKQAEDSNDGVLKKAIDNYNASMKEGVDTKITPELKDLEDKDLSEMTEEEILEAFTPKEETDVSQEDKVSTEKEGDIQLGKEVETEEEVLAESEKTEGDTFPEDEVDDIIEERTLEKWVTRVDQASEWMKANSKIDVTGGLATGIIDGLLVLTKKGLKAGISFRNAFENAKKQYAKTDDYKNLSDADKKKVDGLTPDVIPTGKKAPETSSDVDTWIEELNTSEKFDGETPKKVDKAILSGTKNKKGEVVIEGVKAKMERGMSLKEAVTESIDEYKKSDAFKFLPKSKKDIVNNLTADQFLEERSSTDSEVNIFRKGSTEEQFSNLLEYQKKKTKREILGAERAIVKDFFQRIKEAGQIYKKRGVSLRQLESAMKSLANLNPNNKRSVDAFEAKIKNLLEKVEVKAKRTELKSLQSKLKSALKKARKNAKTKLGELGSTAESLSRVNPNIISEESLDIVIDTLDKFNKALKGEGSLSDSKEQVSRVMAAVSEMEENYKAEREAKILEAKKEAYEEYLESQKKEGEAYLSFDSYQEMIESNKAEEKTKKQEDKLLEAEKKDSLLRSLLKNRIDKLKDYLKNNPNLSPKQKAIIKTLIQSKALISNKNVTSTSNLLSLNNALDEMLTYDSTSGTQQIANELKALREALLANKQAGGKISKSSVFVENKYIRGSTNLATFFKALTTTYESAKKLSSRVVGEYNSNYGKAAARLKSFVNKKNDMQRKLKIKLENSIRTGVVSWLKQNPEGTSDLGRSMNVVDKIESIENQIKRLKKTGKRTKKRKAERLQAAYESLGLKQVKDSILESDNIPGDLQNLLSSNESEFLTFIESEFSNLKGDLAEVYRNNQGQELELNEFFTPTFAKNVDKSGSDLESNTFSNNESIDVDPSGRTIKRAKVDKSGGTIYNFDLANTSTSGMQESLVDIETMSDVKVLKALVDSQPFKELIAGDPDSEYYNPEFYKKVRSRFADLVNKRKSSSLRDLSEVSKFLNRLDKISRASLSMPLKGTDQFIKQPISIIGNTMFRSSPETLLSSFTYMLNPAERKYTEELIKNSNIPTRVTEGDADFNARGLTEMFQDAMIRYTDKGKSIPLKVLNEIIKASGAKSLEYADNLAAKGSWTAFYINERKKQEKKKGNNKFKFDMEKESANPNMEAVEAANIESDWVNNQSDMTTANDMDSVLKKAFFLFKSFSINQSANFFLDIQKLGQKGNAKEATLKLMGAYASALLFTAVKEMALNPFKKELLSNFVDDPDESDKSLMKRLEDEGSAMLLVSLVDLALGFAPDMFLSEGKDRANKAWKDNPKDKNLFYVDKGGFPGAYKLWAEYLSRASEDVDMIIDGTYEKKDGKGTVTRDLSPEEKAVATLDLFSLLMTNQDLAPFTRAAKSAQKKERNKSIWKK